MAVLVTGGTGYIGSHTVVELLELDYKVVIVDDLSNSDDKVLDRIANISGKTPRFYRVDLKDKQALRKIFQENNVEAVIHFAGYKAVGESVSNPLKYYENNILSSINLIQVMNEFNVFNLVFSSSATVYGMNNPSPLKEEYPTNEANNPYGYTKIVIENLLNDISNTDSRWHIIIFRYFNPIGAHQSGLIGEDPKGIPNNLMPYITQVAVGKREKLSVFGDDYETTDGTGVRDYIHVVDLSKGHVRGIQKINQMPGLHTYNLGTGSGVSVLELVNAFEKANNLVINYQICSRRAGDVAINYADVSKVKRELNWETEKELIEMCRDSWNWQKQNPNGY
ncbi:UDP-glucose 4-epimerase GalE [Aerococcaceae bacterium INB8]|uniref:UDP-glucose 4-epimerase n=1 Tax=Ruoffia halotolerans TaxID=2748684 RepID=A0A839A2L6_9LACT|nr:UDP-glucose 4-epimerase GalE [Ruoffia halotolerans]MBA5728436.1 UDP-glucose 4-epimerase GalE [Ruoffia halotolerans]